MSSASGKAWYTRVKAEGGERYQAILRAARERRARKKAEGGESLEAYRRSRRESWERFKKTDKYQAMLERKRKNYAANRPVKPVAHWLLGEELGTGQKLVSRFMSKGSALNWALEHLVLKTSEVRTLEQGRVEFALSRARSVGRRALELVRCDCPMPQAHEPARRVG